MRAEESDEELARRARDGDAAAVAELHRRHDAMLRAHAAGRLPPAMRAKVGASDVVQDAWVGALASLADFEDRGPGSFAAWLRRILEFKAVDEVRRHVEAASRDARREVAIPTNADAVV